MPGFTPPPPAALEEGDYASWSVYDMKADSLATPYRAVAIFSFKEDFALFFDSAQFIKKYDIAAKTLSGNLIDPSWPRYYGESLHSGPFMASMYRKYYLVLDNSENLFYIFKDGALIQTITKTELGVGPADGISSVTISPTGKYVVVTTTDLVDRAWIIMEGS